MTAINALLAVIVFSLLAYVLLAGADFGGGFWDLAAGWHGGRGRDAEGQRKLIATSLGPVWEANHVWLVFVIVCVFSGFPPAFGAMAMSLELPLGFALVGIVLRGAAYVCRAYGGGAALPDRWWGRIFAGASVLTPFMLGVSGAALATGSLGQHSTPTEPFHSAFALLAGVLSVIVTAFLAAVYLCHDAAQSPEMAHLVPLFRRRAIYTGVAAGASAMSLLPFLYRDAPIVAARFTDRSIPAAAISAVFGIGSLLALRCRHHILARWTAAVAVAGVLGGWAAAQYPDLLVGVYTARQSAAAPQSLDTMLIAVGVGMAVILPSFCVLLRVFRVPESEEH
jgi:cytochrome d ubiquinol oxidase subunit II